RRFAGKYKDFGSQYNRCVEEGNGCTPGPDLWVTYSINKEDIWVTRVPVPVHEWVDGPVHDTFDNLKAGGSVTDWNTYSPRWAPVSVVDFPSAANKSLELQDKDPYDYARAIRVFPESKRAALHFKVRAAQNHASRLEVEVTDRFGYRPVRLIFAEDGNLQILNGADVTNLMPYQADKWYDVGLSVDVANGRFDVTLDGKPVKSGALFTEYVKSVERISFRTGTDRERPNFKTSTEADRSPDLVNPDPDLPVPLATFHIDDVTIAP
ncbi:MAG TPA: hypothetical protein VHX68_16060, partial [Planctomycetaceae bacterium]|nr:hypothetical protein [Planctomycetaceae bacterium]